MLAVNSAIIDGTAGTTGMSAFGRSVGNGYFCSSSKLSST
jgi:hypothetical protein